MLRIESSKEVNSLIAEGFCCVFLANDLRFGIDILPCLVEKLFHLLELHLKLDAVLEHRTVLYLVVVQDLLNLQVIVFFD